MNKKYIIIWVISSVILVLVLTTIININTLNRVKKDLINEKSSDDKILVNEIKNQNLKIEIIKKTIEDSEKELKQTKIINVCTKTQLDRLLQNLEYQINYCTWSNLDNFEVGL